MIALYKLLMKKLFGAGYKRSAKVWLIYAVVFVGLAASDRQLVIAPRILYLTVTVFGIGVMARALASDDDRALLRHLFMLPFAEQAFAWAYVAALGTYTFTKMAGLLAVMLAVAPWRGAEIIASLLCAANAIGVTACVYSHWNQHRIILLWYAAIVIVILLPLAMPSLLLLLIANALLAAGCLAKTNAYAFLPPTLAGKRLKHWGKGCLLWRLLLRYLLAHKNYLLNTVIMWGVAWILPSLWQDIATAFVVPLGLAILTLNTPLGILLSCDRALEQAVRALPGQIRLFCVPYGLFIFCTNMTCDGIFLYRFDTITMGMVGTAVIFAALSAAGSVLLEWFFPIKNWTIENDLWHHPRKYLVPALMLLLAGIMGTLATL